MPNFEVIISVGGYRSVHVDAPTEDLAREQVLHISRQLEGIHLNVVEVVAVAAST